MANDVLPAAGPAPPSSLKTWWIAVRPFAFPASAMAVVFGTALAVTVGGAAFNLALAAGSLLAMVLLHAGANVLSDVNDYERGLDTIPLPVSGAVVRGLIDTRTALRGALVLLAAGASIGTAVAVHVGWPIFAIGAAGILLGVTYTGKPLALKYRGLGDVTVFLDFGILGALGAWTVQTGSLSWVPVVWAVPSSMLVAGILHANNWRDIVTDTNCEIRTVASILGDRGSAIYYGFLVLGPFAVVLLLVILTKALAIEPAVPPAMLLTFLALPFAIMLVRRAMERTAPRRPFDFAALDGATAQLNLIFGLLATGSLLLAAGIG